MSRWRRVLKAVEPHPGEHFKDKAIAIALALLLWVAVAADVPVQQIFQGVPVSIVNPPTDLAIAEEWNEIITVWVSGSERDLGGVTAGRLSTQLDLSDATAGDNPFFLEDLIPAPSGVEVLRADPSQIHIVLEARVDKLVDVSPVVAGEPAFGYEVVGKTTNPPLVSVSGPSSLLDLLDRVDTATVDVAGRRNSLTQTVTLLPPHPLIELPRERSVLLNIEILERAVNKQFDAVQVVVINNEYQVDVNPAELSVVLRGPRSLLDQVQVESLRMVIDAEGLAPRLEDYLREPQLMFDPVELGESLELYSIYPQRRINVHVYDRARRQ